MGKVYKHYYAHDNIGQELKDKLEKFKKRAEIRAFTKTIKNSDFYNNIALFRNGNDAMLRYIPNGNIRKKVELFANSHVNDKQSPFAHPYPRWRYVLIPQHQSNFEVIQTNARREYGQGFHRSNDTEYKLLEELSRHLNPQDQGQIYLYTTLEPCLSCDYVIIQFSKKYPYIKMRIYYQKSYNVMIGEL